MAGRPLSAPPRSQPLQYVSTYIHDFPPKQPYPGHRFSAADYQGYPVPFAPHAGADTPNRFVSATHKQFRELDLDAARAERRSAFNFQGRPIPFALDGRATPDRYVSAAQRQFRDRQTARADQVERRQAFDFQGRPIPYALDEQETSYISAAQRQFQDHLRGDGRRPDRARAPAGRGQPFATDPGARAAGEWSTEYLAHYNPPEKEFTKRILASRQQRTNLEDFDYNP
jgi:hypothetical protein